MKRTTIPVRRFDRLDAVGVVALVLAAGVLLIVGDAWLADREPSLAELLAAAQLLALLVAFGLGTVLSDAFKRVR